MRRSLLPYLAATAGVAVVLSACQQRQEDTPDPPAAPAADVAVTPPPDVTVNPPDVNIKAPDVDVDVPEGKVTRESTTVDVPGVGSTTTTTVEKK